jgi:hypothetical protein
VNLNPTESDIRIERIDDDVYKATSIRFGGLSAEGSTAAEAERLLLELLSQRAELMGGLHTSDVLVEADELDDDEEV